MIMLLDYISCQTLSRRDRQRQWLLPRTEVFGETCFKKLQRKNVAFFEKKGDTQKLFLFITVLFSGRTCGSCP